MNTKWAGVSKMNAVNILSEIVMFGQAEGTMALIPMEHVALVCGIVNLANILLRSYTSQPVTWTKP